MDSNKHKLLTLRNQQTNGKQSSYPPSNNLVWAILTTLFCCLPFGVVSIIHSCKVDSLYNAGDYAGAVEKAKQAKKWAKWALIAGIAQYVIIAIYYAFVIVAVASLNAE